MVLNDRLQDLIQHNVFGDFHKKVCNNAFVLYLIILAESPDGEMTEASLELLMTRSGWSLGKVYACLVRLEEVGLIERTLPGKPGQTQVYKIYRPRVLKNGQVSLRPASSHQRNGYGLEISKELRQQIYERDHHQCQGENCTHTVRLLLHHIDSDRRNKTSQNLITLCTTCHGKVKRDRKFWRKYFEEKK